MGPAQWNDDAILKRVAAAVETDDAVEYREIVLRSLGDGGKIVGLLLGQKTGRGHTLCLRAVDDDKRGHHLDRYSRDIAAVVGDMVSPTCQCPGSRDDVTPTAPLQFSTFTLQLHIRNLPF